MWKGIFEISFIKHFVVCIQVRLFDVIFCNMFLNLIIKSLNSVQYFDKIILLCYIETQCGLWAYFSTHSIFLIVGILSLLGVIASIINGVIVCNKTINLDKKVIIMHRYRNWKWYKN